MSVYKTTREYVDEYLLYIIAKNLDLTNLNLSGLTGGDLKNVVLNAAGLAAKDDAEKIGINHIQDAIKIVKAPKQDENWDSRYIT